MAKKKQETASLIETFAEFKQNKNIDLTTMVGVLEESFRSVIAKIFGSDENFDVIVNPDKGDCEIHFADFGRRAILTLRQTLASKILELEHDALYNKYKDRVGELITAEVYQTWKSETLLMDEEKNELYLPKSQQIPRDFFHKGDAVTAVIDRVDNSNGNPKIYLSRTSNDFLRRLLENEIPEIADGAIRLCRIARIPGERAKIAVESYDDRIDPVGACVGVRGSRIHGVVRELHNENIDVINFTNNTALFIQRALNPAQVSNVVLHEEERKAEVYLRPAEVSLAIGKGGMNIKLASMLTEYTIDVFREVEGEEMTEDIYLDEFADEIDQWVIDAIKGIGLETAKDVLNAPREMLIEKADLEESTVDEVLRVLRAEFENDAPQAPAAQPTAEAPADANEPAAEPAGEES